MVSSSNTVEPKYKIQLSFSQLENAYCLISVTDLGIEIFSKAENSKALQLIVLTFSPLNITDFKAVQLKKALVPISITFSGIVISCKVMHCEKAYGLISVIVSGSVIDCNFSQPLNADIPITVTELGILNDSNSIHPLNALLPIFVKTPFEFEFEFELKVIVFKEIHPSKALSPISVTVEGIVTVWIDFWLVKRLEGIIVNVSGIVNSVKTDAVGTYKNVPSIDERTPFVSLYTVFPSSTVIVVNKEHPLNEDVWIEVTLFGTVIFVRVEQSENR